MSGRKGRCKTVIGATSVAVEALCAAEEALRQVEQARDRFELAARFSLLASWGEEIKDAADAGFRLSRQFRPDAADEEVAA